ncbi:MAG: SEL1-like repeat protein [Zoogloeaceae bacterium]|nr:SEL1-like repeat protein [Zoogloeaceae bacterium]
MLERHRRLGQGEGEGITQNQTEAVKWYRKAAEQGDAEAQAARRLIPFFPPLLRVMKWRI